MAEICLAKENITMPISINDHPLQYQQLYSLLLSIIPQLTIDPITAKVSPGLEVPGFHGGT